MMTGSASSSSLSPPAQLRPRGPSLTSSSSDPSSSPLTIQPISFSQLSSSSTPAVLMNGINDGEGAGRQHNHLLLDEPQTPSSIIRKSKAPTTIIQQVVEHPSNISAPSPTRQSSTGSIAAASVVSSSSGSSSSSFSHQGNRHHGHGHGRRAHRTHTRSPSGHHHRHHHPAGVPSSPFFASGPDGRRTAHAYHAYEYNDMDLLDDEDGNGGPTLASGAANMLTGGPHRPMLSVLLSLGVSALPISTMTFTRPRKPARSRANADEERHRGFRTPKGTGSRSATVSASTSARSSFSQDDDAQSPYPFPSSPYTSLFLAPPPPKAVKRIVVSRSNKLKVSSSFFLPILLLLALFVVTLFPITLGLYSLPLRSFYQTSSAPTSLADSSFNSNSKTLNIPPRTIADVAALATSLRTYATSSERAKIHVLLVLSMTAIWKHAWSIPGSVVLNVIAGTLFTTPTSSIPGRNAGGIGGGIVMATLLMTLLTTMGSIVASMLSMPLAPLVRTFFPRALDVTRSALEGGSSTSSLPSAFTEKSGGMNKRGTEPNGRDGTPTWVRLVVMRLVGVVPWSGINVACGVCGVSYFDCFVGTFIGTMPWTAVTCQVCTSYFLLDSGLVLQLINLLTITVLVHVQCSYSFRLAISSKHSLPQLQSPDLVAKVLQHRH